MRKYSFTSVIFAMILVISLAACDSSSMPSSGNRNGERTYSEDEYNRLLRRIESLEKQINELRTEIANPANGLYAPGSTDDSDWTPSTEIDDIPIINNPPPSDLNESPARDFEYVFNAALGGVEITDYLGTSIRVRIPEYIEGVPVKAITNSAFGYSGIMYVYLPNTLEIIDWEAFQRCTGLTNITIPNSVTYIGYCAFEGSGLTNISIPDSVTRIGTRAFADCRSLTNMAIGYGVTHIEGGAFSSTGLSSIAIPDNVTSVAWRSDSGGAFRGNFNLVATYNGIEYSAIRHDSYGFDLPQEFYDAINSR